MSVVGRISVGADVFWSGDRESVSAVWDDLRLAGQMTLKRWLEEAGEKVEDRVWWRALGNAYVSNSGRLWAVDD
ncbi:jg15529 [Pararge aegeria aegeria]|uniref:Jg15529 protein n=1 Tax=Pararge aegeria aegeria TaxID=348720 RepID=A0A8S4SB18_9NEOP|nr:jg15529 [Pararge aegeria aegeria]